MLEVAKIKLPFSNRQRQLVARNSFEQQKNKKIQQNLSGHENTISHLQKLGA
jgi:hypothetical protein